MDIVLANVSASVMMDSNHINGNNDVLVQQRTKTNIFMVIMTAVVAVAFAVLFGAQTFAQASKSASTSVLKVSPVRTDVEVPAGTSKTVQATVTNLTNAPIVVKAITNDFVAGDERGTPALILDADKFAPTHSLKRYMKPVADITIPAKKSKTVDVVITVPKDAQPGGYFGAVRFAPTSIATDAQVNLSASAASLILMTVPGPAIEKLNLTDFAIQQAGKSGSYFQTPNDLQATVRFQNKGSIQLGPFGKVTVKNGDKVVYDVDFNNKDQRDMILPDSARRWDVPLKNIDSFGYYTVTGTFSYGKDNQTIEVEQSFWVVPQFVIFAAIGGTIFLILLIIGIILLIRSIKRRKQRGQSRRGGFRR